MPIGYQPIRRSIERMVKNRGLHLALKDSFVHPYGTTLPEMVNLIYEVEGARGVLKIQHTLELLEITSVFPAALSNHEELIKLIRQHQGIFPVEIFVPYFIDYHIGGRLSLIYYDIGRGDSADMVIKPSGLTDSDYPLLNGRPYEEGTLILLDLLEGIRER